MLKINAFLICELGFNFKSAQLRNSALRMIPVIRITSQAFQIRKPAFIIPITHEGSISVLQQRLWTPSARSSSSYTWLILTSNLTLQRGFGWSVMMVRQTRDGLCSEGTLLVCGALKQTAFDLLEMPQVIVFRLKVVLQHTCGMSSALRWNWRKGLWGDSTEGAVRDLIVDVYFQAAPYFILVLFRYNRESILLFRAICAFFYFHFTLVYTYSTLSWVKDREEKQ